MRPPLRWVVVCLLTVCLFALYSYLNVVYLGGTHGIGRKRNQQNWVCALRQVLAWRQIYWEADKAGSNEPGILECHALPKSSGELRKAPTCEGNELLRCLPSSSARFHRLGELSSFCSHVSWRRRNLSGKFVSCLILLIVLSNFLQK